MPVHFALVGSVIGLDYDFLKIEIEVFGMEVAAHVNFKGSVEEVDED
jgi:hypothetical protein